MRAWLVCLSLALLLAPRSAAQRRFPGVGNPPLLEAEDRIRVWAWQPAFTPPGAPGSIAIMRPPWIPHQVRFAGRLVAYDPPDSVRIRKTGLLAVFSLTREPTLAWTDVARIDVPNGRDVLGGAARGLAGAFTMALMGGLVERAFGCESAGTCANVFGTTARLAGFSVPAGAVVGFFFTRWKRVY